MELRCLQELQEQLQSAVQQLLHQGAVGYKYSQNDAQATFG